MTLFTAPSSLPIVLFFCPLHAAALQHTSLSSTSYTHSPGLLTSPLHVDNSQLCNMSPASMSQFNEYIQLPHRPHLQVEMLMSPSEHDQNQILNLAPPLICSPNLLHRRKRPRRPLPFSFLSDSTCSSSANSSLQY